jgi:integrase
VRGAHWPEFDLTIRIWVIPAERMKAGREHRVPLCDRAVAILEDMTKLRVGDFVFPGGKATKGLSDGGMERVLDRMARPVTVHGFRSTFRDWVSEETEHSREIAEAALAHIFGDSTERAYRRGDALEKRRRLMNDWADFCTVHQPRRLNAGDKA